MPTRRWPSKRKTKLARSPSHSRKGAHDIVRSIRDEVEKMGDEFDPDRVAALRPSERVMARLRAKLEQGLLGAYDKGAEQGLDAIEASTKSGRVTSVTASDVVG